jgi:hypothetical protein
VFDVLSRIPSSTVDKVSSFHFFEHIENLSHLMLEVARIVRPGGTLEIVVPHFSNPYFYSDFTHRRPFGLYSMCYFASSNLFAREVPTYGARLSFELVDVRLGFKSARPFYIRYGLKKCLGLLFNSSNYLKEFWEENLCFAFPCYEIAYSLRR